MCCLNYAIKYYSDYKTRIDDLYYAAKLVFFSLFNCYFNGKIDKKNITELTTDEQNDMAYSILAYSLDEDVVFPVNVDIINQDWLNLDDLSKLDPDNYKTGTGTIKIPNLVINSKQDKLEDVIPKYLEEIRNEIKYLHTAHDDFKTMINDIIENKSIIQPNNKTIEKIKQIIESDGKKIVCIPVFCMNRHTSSFNYKLMESVINNINEKIKKEAGVKEDTSPN